MAGPPGDGEAGGGAVPEGGHREGEADPVVEPDGPDERRDHLDRVGTVVAGVEDVEVGIADGRAESLVGKVVGPALQRLTLTLQSSQPFQHKLSSKNLGILNTILPVNMIMMYMDNDILRKRLLLISCLCKIGLLIAAHLS